MRPSFRTTSETHESRGRPLKTMDFNWRNVVLCYIDEIIDQYSNFVLSIQISGCTAKRVSDDSVRSRSRGCFPAKCPVSYAKNLIESQHSQYISRSTLFYLHDPMKVSAAMRSARQRHRFFCHFRPWSTWFLFLPVHPSSSPRPRVHISLCPPSTIPLTAYIQYI